MGAGQVSPWENGCCESFNGEIFYSLKEAMIVIERWRKYYNEKRPPSSAIRLSH
jgi:putative transposase